MVSQAQTGVTVGRQAPNWRQMRYRDWMPSIQVKDVPDDVHAALRKRAASAGMSLQEYLLGRLTDDAHTPTLEELLDSAGGRAGGRAPLRAAAKAVRADRDAR
jgi:antitoxin FitA